MKDAPKTTRLSTLQQLKERGQPFACLTAYDAGFARLISEAGIEVQLVGDSLGMVIQGHDSTLPVRLQHMAYHTACVARGNRHSLLIADMPFGSYGDPVTALRSAATLIRAGAEVVKMEGGEWLVETVERLHNCGIPVCAHLGLQPQSIRLYKGYTRQGTSLDEAVAIARQALALERAGAVLLVIEHVPADLGAYLAQNLSIPVIGIGAGPGTDGQVLVLQDILGISAESPPFSRNFLSEAEWR